MTLSEMLDRQRELKERLTELQRQKEETEHVISKTRVELMELEMRAAETRSQVQGLSWLNQCGKASSNVEKSLSKN